MQDIALFDFDGTITNCDTLWDFHRFVFGDFGILFAIICCFPYLLGNLLGVVAAQTAKEAVLSYFWKGKPQASLQKYARSYKVRIAKKIRNEALAAIKYQIDCKNMLVIVSASVADWIEPWAQDNGFHEVIASQMQVSNGIFTGKLVGKNCSASEKSRRVCEKFNIDEYGCVYVYGDSAGDKEMLALGSQGKRFYRWRSF